MNNVREHWPFYNSIVFQSLKYNTYNYTQVSKKFIFNCNIDKTLHFIVKLRSNLKPMCFKAFIKQFIFVDLEIPKYISWTLSKYKFNIVNLIRV